MDVFDADILALWKCLHQNEVRHIMIGGFVLQRILIYGLMITWIIEKNSEKHLKNRVRVIIRQ
jgi:hypothetical protein